TRRRWSPRPRTSRLRAGRRARPSRRTRAVSFPRTPPSSRPCTTWARRTQPLVRCRRNHLTNVRARVRKGGPRMANKLNKVKHLVVLMLENRSFDHLLGYLKANGIKPAVDGLIGNETNFTSPSTSTGPVMVSPSAGNTDPKPDAGH